MYMISDKTKKNIERVVGLPLEKLSVMTIAEERAWIEQKNKSPLKFSKRRRYGFVGRGNPLILFASTHSKRGNIITIVSIIITLISIVVTAITIALA